MKRFNNFLDNMIKDMDKKPQKELQKNMRILEALIVGALGLGFIGICIVLKVITMQLGQPFYWEVAVSIWLIWTIFTLLRAKQKVGNKER